MTNTSFFFPQLRKFWLISQGITSTLVVISLAFQLLFGISHSFSRRILFSNKKLFSIYQIKAESNPSKDNKTNIEDNKIYLRHKSDGPIHYSTNSDVGNGPIKLGNFIALFVRKSPHLLTFGCVKPLLNWPWRSLFRCGHKGLGCYTHISCRVFNTSSPIKLSKQSDCHPNKFW